MKLRDYQQKFISDVRREFANGVKKVCGVAPCGAGKTVIAAFLVKSSVIRKKRTIFFVHRKELIEQTSKTFAQLNIRHGIISADFEFQPEIPVQIASIQTLINRLDNVPAPDFLICDECHHILANTYKKIINHWKEAYLLGLTATPLRMGGIRLGDVFQSMVLAQTTADLICMGNLTNFRYFAPDLKLSLEKLHVKRGDYVNAESAKLMSNYQVVCDIVNEYKKHAKGKSAICYCVNIEHSKLVAQQFINAGITAAQCDGTTPKKERQQLVEDFRRGKIKILCNAELFGEGFDVPNMDAVILARPTKSLTVFIQQAMRPLRPDPNNPNKVALIIDCVNNFSSFGLPSQKRNWSLDPNEKKESGVAPMKICPECSEVVPAATKICNCGYEFEFEEKPVLESVTSEIPSSFQYYLNIANQRGYKKQWAVFKFLENEVQTEEEILEVRNFMGYKKGWEKYQLHYLERN